MKINKYTFKSNKGNVFPVDRETAFLLDRGSVFPAKYINLNLFKEISAIVYLAFINARIDNNLAIIAIIYFLTLQLISAPSKTIDIITPL